jgi:hypothetical protein
MPLLNTGVAGSGGGSSLPSLAFASAIAQAEGSGGTTVFSFTLNLTRNGNISAIPFTWAVTGTGASPADAGDFLGGVLPSGSGSFASGETSKTINISIAGDSSAEPDENFIVTAHATLSLAAAAGAGTIVNEDAPPPPELLIGARFNQMGFNGYTGSDGTDTDSNSRISSFNETGATVTKLRAYFTNWMANSVNEQNGYNAVTVTAALEYPSGTLTPLTFAGSASKMIQASDLAMETDELTLPTPIPAGAQFWIRTYVSVAAGGKWVQGYAIRTANGEAADFSSGVDKTLGGPITNATASATRRGYGPAAVKATAFSGTPVSKAFAAVGDSIIMGSTDGNFDSHGNTGYFPRACGGLYPVINLGIAGTAAQSNKAANLTRRLDLMGRIGITHVFGNWAVNDIKGGRTAAQLRSDVESIAGSLKGGISGVKVIWASCTPQTTSTDGWKTTANQTIQATPAGAFTGGASSQRSLYNAALRAGFTNVDHVFDAADAVETGRDSGIWRAGEASTHLTNSGASTDVAATDGLHPSVTNTTAPGFGGIFLLRDAAVTEMPTWM